MENPPGPSSSRKRPRDEEDLDQTSGSIQDSLMFSDTLVALRIMRAQFPKLNKVPVEPFILRSQLYSSVHDRTEVDRELESLRREKTLRIFKLNTGQDDHAIMFTDDYLNQLERAVKRIDSKKQDGFAVFDWFKTHVIFSKLEPSISHEELCLLLAIGGKVKDGHISLLINAGLLTRQLIDPNIYWFSIPNIGSLLKGISQGRKELLSLLNRRKYKEMMLAPLEKKHLRLSPMDMRFHLRDLIGSGHIKTAETASEVSSLLELLRNDGKANIKYVMRGVAAVISPGATNSYWIVPLSLLGDPFLIIEKLLARTDIQQIFVLYLAGALDCSSSERLKIVTSSEADISCSKDHPCASS